MLVSHMHDSYFRRWWQGLGVASSPFKHSSNQEENAQISPLAGIDLSLHSAQALAMTLDNMTLTKSAKLVNFAHVVINNERVLGQGSFSKVFRGTYKLVPCAVKVVFTTDLTSEDVLKAATEAKILSTFKSINIVETYGVSVNPPSICILLELCALGSLSDVLRGSGGTGIFLSLIVRTSK